MQALTTVSLFQTPKRIMSHIFADSPIREPPTGRRRDILNQKYDHILVCLDAILNRAERGLEEVRIAVTEAREAEVAKNFYKSKYDTFYPNTQRFLSFRIRSSFSRAHYKKHAQLTFFILFFFFLPTHFFSLVTTSSAVDAGFQSC